MHSYTTDVTKTNLQDVTSLRSEEGGILDDEELLFLGGPQHPPGSGELHRADGGDSRTLQRLEGMDGLQDLRSIGGVPLGGEASIVTGDEREEVITSKRSFRRRGERGSRAPAGTTQREREPWVEG